MSFDSVSLSLQQADDADFEEQLQEQHRQSIEQMHGFLVSYSISCLSSICTYIEDQKIAAAHARKEKLNA
jgi:hypothetical protein